MKNKNSRTMVISATLGDNLASMFFGEFSQIGSNFGESEDSTNSPISINVTALMVDSAYMNEKFAMMEETIKAMKKSIHEIFFHIAQLMNN